MNKLITLVVLVLVSAASAGQSNTHETEKLQGNEKLFSEFCVSSHDFIVNELRTMVQEKSALLFKQFFTSTSDVFDEVLHVNRDAMEQLSNQIAHPETPIPQASNDQSEIDRLIQDGRRRVQDTPGPKSLIPAIQTSGMAMLNTLTLAVMTRLPESRSALEGMAIQEGVLKYCGTAHDLVGKLDAQLVDAKAKLLAKHQNPQLQSFINNILLANLNCSTSKNIVRMSAFCKIFRDGYKPFRKMLGIPVE